MTMLRKETTRVFHRTLYAGMLETVTLRKRDDDLRQGVVKTILLFECWRGAITKTGETIDGEESSDERTQWHLPVIELERNGVNYINNLDVIVDSDNHWWQPEATVSIDLALHRNHYVVNCLRVDPNSVNVVAQGGSP